MSEKSIEVFRHLRLVGENPKQMRDAVLGCVKAPWSHSPIEELTISESAVGDETVIVLHRSRLGKIDESALFLLQEKDGYRLANIVPMNSGSLGIASYNKILEDFVAKIAKPARKKTEFSIEMSGKNESLPDWTTPNTSRALIAFSSLANKSTGYSHPLDRSRWFEFLTTAHEEKKKLDPEQLARWLVEVDGWPDEVAQDLAADYETSLELLGYYDNRR